MTPKAFAIKCVNDRLGAAQDNLHRARSAFRNHTSQQMSEKYGQSDQTCTEIVKGYEESEREALDALTWLNTIPG